MLRDAEILVPKRGLGGANVIRSFRKNRRKRMTKHVGRTGGKATSTKRFLERVLNCRIFQEPSVSMKDVRPLRALLPPFSEKFN